MPFDTEANESSARAARSGDSVRPTGRRTQRAHISDKYTL